MEHNCMLTTFDNPYNPFEDFSLWFLFDVDHGYNTCARLGRLVNITNDMTQNEIDEETERAIDEIIEYDFMNIYRKITKDSVIQAEQAI